ncbi:MAG: hypothetical protein U1F06_07560 [Steroidobacteraceae bacterium]
MSAAGVRPLVMRCGAMGDMVLLLPLLQALQRRFGTPVDVVGSGGWTRPLLQDQPGVGELFLLQSRRRPYLVSPDQWRVVADLRRRGPAPTWFLDDDGAGAGLLARRHPREVDRRCRRLPAPGGRSTACGAGRALRRSRRRRCRALPRPCRPCAAWSLPPPPPAVPRWTRCSPGTA